jgi:hypothetical protein
MAWGGVAAATECGEARIAYAHFKAAAEVEQFLHHAGPAHDARAGLESAEKKMHAACGAKKVSIVALPVGYVSSAPGNASKSTFAPGEAWSLQLTTNAGASNGVVFFEPAALSLPEAVNWESPKPGELFVAVASDAQLTVEEPEAGKGTWKIEVKTAPQLIAMSALRQCAAGKGDAGAKLDKASCAMLVRVDPVASASALPEPGRAVYVGEWQYGWHAGLEVGELEMSQTPTLGPTPRVELPLSLSAAIPSVSDGKKLLIAVQGAGLQKPTGATLKLAHECGNEDEKCQKERFNVQVWFDRAFGVPFVRVRPAGAAKATATGKVADRLAKPMVGQRVMLLEPGRKIVTITDDIGEYHFDNLAGGEATVFPVGKAPIDKPGNQESRKQMIGVGEAKVPILYVTKLFE